MTFFKGLQFSHTKNKLKSEIFNDKKVYRQKHFSVIIKNSSGVGGVGGRAWKVC